MNANAPSTQAYNGNEPYIFISYSHRDTNIVVPTIQEMQKNGLRVWYDSGIEAGTEWSNNIAGHLRDCSVFVAFISKNSVKSENCLDEIAFAKSNQKPSLLIFIDEDATLPEGTEMQTARFQRMFFRRQTSTESFVQNLCEASIFDSCRKTVIAKVDPDNIPSPVPPKKASFNSKWLLIAALGAALIIIVLLLVLLLDTGYNDRSQDFSQESQENSENFSQEIQESSEASREESVAAPSVTMSDDLYDCTFTLEGAVYKLPCPLSAFTDKGWAISSAGYSSDKLINGQATDTFKLSKDGKKIAITIANRSGNKTRLDECPIIALALTVEDGAKIELAKGITQSSDDDDIIRAFGTPYSADEATYYNSLVYLSDDEYSYAAFYLYKDGYEESSGIELGCYRFSDTVTTETNTALPEYISQYSAPTELGNDVLSGNFKLEGDVYRIPAPVKAFLNNGWSIKSAPKYIVAGDSEEIKITKGSATLEVTVFNLADYQTTPENCIVTNLPVYDYDNVDIELPNGIKLYMTESELDARVPESMDKTSSTYSISYDYSSISPRDLYIYLYIDADSEDFLSYIRLNSEEWDYGN